MLAILSIYALLLFQGALAALGNSAGRLGKHVGFTVIRESSRSQLLYARSTLTPFLFRLL